LGPRGGLPKEKGNWQGKRGEIHKTLRERSGTKNQTRVPPKRERGVTKRKKGNGGDVQVAGKVIGRSREPGTCPGGDRNRGALGENLVGLYEVENRKKSLKKKKRVR